MGVLPLGCGSTVSRKIYGAASRLASRASLPPLAGAGATATLMARWIVASDPDVPALHLLPLGPREERSARDVSGGEPDRVRCLEGPPLGGVPEVPALEPGADRGALGARRGSGEALPRCAAARALGEHRAGEAARWHAADPRGQGAAGRAGRVALRRGAGQAPT